MHHIIDPATGEPADRGVVAVVAQADEAWWAEGVAKAALVAGVDAGLELLERLGVAAVVVDDDGRRHPTTRWAALVSAAMDPRVWWWVSHARRASSRGSSSPRPWSGDCSRRRS